MINQETWNFIRQHAGEDTRALALKKTPHPDIDLKVALQQIEGRQLARKKLPLWAHDEQLIFPPRISMEQCSSETTALYKRKLVQRLLESEEAPGDMADLTGGFGIDFSYMASCFKQAYYIERQEHLCRIAAHNFPLLHLTQAQIVCGDGIAFLEATPPLQMIFLDPARRDANGNKTVVLADCEPDVTQIQKLLLDKATWVVIKLSPMLDIRQAVRQLSHIHEVHIISVDNECKELLLVMNRKSQERIRFHCHNCTRRGDEDFLFTWEDEADTDICYAPKLKTYLYEPNASILKAGAFKQVARQFDLEKLHPNSHLYTSDRLLEDFPGRTFHIEAAFSMNKKEVRKQLQDIKQANITVRNFPATVNELRKKLKLHDGGHIYLFCTTLSQEEHILIKCSKTDG